MAQVSRRTDADLVAASQVQEVSAFSELVERYHRVACALAFATVISGTVTDARGEALQGVYVEADPSDDIQRLNLLLDQAADAGRRYRLREGGMGLALATGLGLASWRSFRTNSSTNGWIYGVGATLTGLVSLTNFLRSSDAEKARSYFVGQLRHPTADPALVAAETAGRLEKIGEEARSGRQIMSIISYAGAGLLAATGAHAIYDGETEAGIAFGSTSLALVGLGLWGHYDETPVERMWSSAPELSLVPQLSLIPTQGGASLGLTGQF